MECITATKTNLKATLFFETAIKQGNKGDENQIYHLHIKNTQVLLKNAKFKEAYEHLAAYNDITTALNDEDKLKKDKRCRNLSWMNTKEK
jgi:hypothetical protein